MKHGKEVWGLSSAELLDQRLYVFGSRPATHLLFWSLYYLCFSLIWAKPEYGYTASFFLEFILLPIRIMAVYTMIYVLMPQFLFKRKYQQFILSYALLLLFAGLLQRLSGHYFYAVFFELDPQPFWSAPGLIRSAVLINTTVVFVASIRLLQCYLLAQDTLDSRQQPRLEVRADRRTHLIDPHDISYLEGMGNYLVYHMTDGTKLVSHGSMKSAQGKLPSFFVRLHKSYLVNCRHIRSFNHEDVIIGDTTLPRGKDIEDSALLCPGLQ